MRPKRNLHKIYEFGPFRLDGGQLMLYRDGDEVSAPPKAVETLIALIEREGEIVSKDELMDAVWADTIVEESNLARYIHLLRATLGGQESGKPYIDTYRRRGYRFNGRVSVLAKQSQQEAVRTGVALSEDLRIEHPIVRDGTSGNVVSFSDWHRAEPENARRPPRNNLPAPLSSLIGRTKELLEIKDLVLRADIRLLTLTGPGGTGKTRLSLALAHDVLNDFPDGVFFIELASITDTELVAPTIVGELKVEHTGASPAVNDLISYLRSREILLVLDNFEQILGAASLTKELLQTCPRLKIVTTSREPLRIRGEQEFHVAPLDVPSSSMPDAVDELSNSAAVQLFVERARLVDRQFDLTKTNAGAVADICRRLDGLPLAIELAAVGIRSHSVADLAERLSSGLKLPAGARDLPDRQRTMRSAVGWSYDLLDETEKSLFRQLSVFVGGFTQNAAETVCEVPAIEDVSEVLSSLVEKNLLQRKKVLHREPRFIFLETIREFAQEMLASSANVKTLRDRHAAFFHNFAKHAERELLGREQPRVLKRLDAEDDNFRAALGWLAECGKTELELKLASSLSPWWLLKGHLTEGIRRLTDILARAPSEDSPARAKALVSLGQMLWMIGDYETTLSICEEGLAIANRLGVEVVAARCLFYIALSRLYRYDDVVTASVYLEEGLRRSRALGFDMGQVFCLTGLADIYRRTDVSRAADLLDQAVAIARESGNHVSLSVSLAKSASVAVQTQEYTVAEQQGKESLRLRSELGDWCGMVLCMEPLATIAIAKGHADRATLMLAAMDPIIEAAGASSPSVVRSDHERNLELVRRELDQTKFDQLWRHGRRMSPEEVIEFALGRPTEH